MNVKKYELQADQPYKSEPWSYNRLFGFKVFYSIMISWKLSEKERWMLNVMLRCNWGNETRKRTEQRLAIVSSYVTQRRNMQYVVSIYW